MRLTSVTIRGFRGYLNEQTVHFGDMTTLIGKNDVGKSTVLEALEIFFNSEIVKLEAADCHVDSEDGVVEISCSFADVPDPLVLDAQAETSLAAEYLLTDSGELRIKKVWNCNAARPKEEVYVQALHPSKDKMSDLLGLTNAALKTRFRELGVPSDAANLSNNPSIRQAIWNSTTPNELALRSKDIPASTGEVKGIWEKLSQHLPLYALFQSDRASRDSDSEVQDPMKLAVATALAEDDVRKKLEDVVESVRKHATALATRTHEALEKLDPALADELTPRFKAEPKWAGLFSLSLDGDRGIPINKRGSGVRRLVLVSFFRAEAERKLHDGATRNIIYAIEEPETSQHPRNQRLLLESLKSLSETDGCQVLLTSHSPGFASYLDAEDLRFILRGDDGLPQVQPASEGTWEQIADELGVVPDNRVKVLICVEGPTDVEALNRLSGALHQQDPSIVNLATDPRIAFVVLGGGTLLHWVNHHYLRGLKRPEIHIYDRDVEKYAAMVAEVNKRDDGSWGVQTQKYEIENYLTPAVVRDAIGVDIAFDDDADVPKLVGEATGWKANTTKKKLSTLAFPRMTATELAASDPDGEVRGWLQKIVEIASA